jgi:hypothetical protein
LALHEFVDWFIVVIVLVLDGKKISVTLEAIANEVDNLDMLENLEVLSMFVVNTDDTK